MVRLLSLLNSLKREARFELLTDSQRVAWEEIQERLRFPERVNLFGSPGSGKTFLGWALAKTLQATYAASPAIFAESAPAVVANGLVIVDNSTSDERELRRLLAEFQLRGSRKALILSRERNPIGLSVVQLLPPSTQDINVAYHNLSLLEYYALSPCSEGSLWQVIHSTLK